MTYTVTTGDLEMSFASPNPFSPNGDGVLDSVELHYRVLEPVNLEFSVFNENQNLVRTIRTSHEMPGPDFITWDGHDDYGRIVPDGRYDIKVIGY